MNNLKHIIYTGILVIFLAGVNEAHAQTTRDSKETFDSGTNSQFSSKKKVSKKAYYKSYDQGLKDYEELMKANKKKYSKMQKGMQKPQYSDPSYFGHKKKPKKRKLGKRKFCEECGIVH